MNLRACRRSGLICLILLASLTEAAMSIGNGPLLASPLEEKPPRPKRPNIVLFLVDDMGWQETSVPFHETPTELNLRYQTPAMESLARDGVRFTRAYASAVCSPTRISIISGMNAARHGVTNWTLRRGLSPDDENKELNPPRWNLNGATTVAGIEGTVQITPLPELLRQTGYRTIHVGKAHFGADGTPGADPRHFGFEVNIGGHAAGAPGSYWGERNFSSAWRSPNQDRIWDVPGLEAWHGQSVNLTEVLTTEAIRELERSVSADVPDRPFFLYLSHYAVHSPWEEDKRFYQKYLDRGLKPFDALRASMIEGMDKSLGDLRAALERLGVANETLFIFASDNGAPHAVAANLPLRGQKLAPYEGGIRVPMILHWPGRPRLLNTSRTPVIIEDLFPTILEAAGVDWKTRTRQVVDGRSLIPLIDRREATSARSDKAAKSATSNRPLIFHFPHQYYGQGPFSALVQNNWKLIYHHQTRAIELYDIGSDIGEQNNLGGKLPAIRRKLAAILARVLRNHQAMMPTDRSSGRLVPLP